MNEEEIKKLWQQQSGLQANLGHELFRVAEEEVITIEKKIEWRDRLEYMAILLVFPVSLLAFFFVQHPLAKTGVAIIAGACLISAVTFFLYRKKDFPKEQRPVKEQLKEHLKYLYGQKKILRNVTIWYLGPFYAGLILFFYAAYLERGNLAGFVLPTAFMTVVYFIIWRMNQKVVIKDLDPLIQKLQIMLLHLEKE